MADINQTNPILAETGSIKKESRAISPVKLTDILAITIKYWYWVVASVAFCLIIAFLIVHCTLPIYTRSCTLVIRDDAASSVGSSSVDLSELGIGMSNTILEDEMAALKSPDLMEQVVRKLHLDVDYTMPGTFHEKVLYGSNLPLTVSFPDMPDDEGASLKIEISEEGAITVSDMVVNRRRFALPDNGIINFGNVIGTPSGRIIIDKTPFFKKGKEYEIDVTRMPIRMATEIYEAEISVLQSNKQSNVVQISCNDASMQRGDEILTSLVNAYNQDWIKSRAQVVAVTSNFITDRLNSLETELGSVDSDISSFKSTNLIPDLSAVSSMALEQSSSASNQIITLSNQLQMARYLRNYISTEGKNTVLPVNTGIGADATEGLISQYNTLMIQRNSLLANTSESNPLIIDIDSRLAALRSSILSSLDNQVMSLSNSIANMQRSEQTANARVAANPRQAKYLLTAERQQKVKETLYLYLLQKREENELSQAFTSVNTRMLRQPSGLPFPTTPKPNETYAIAFLIGLLLPFGIIYLIELNNTKVRGKKDLEGVTMPIIGEIPEFSHPSHKRRLFGTPDPTRMRDSMKPGEDAIVKEGSRNLVNEAFRVLRTNVSFITADTLPCVAMITSFNPGSGKTFITVNLGISLAIKGKKVLLIDGDMRRASLSAFVGNPHKGMADYLTGSMRDIEPLIVKNSLCEGLGILPVGHIPPNPTELLETTRFRNMIDYLRTEYDYILIDCPPIYMMADSSIINTVTERTFFVVRVGVFERGMIPELQEIYDEKKYHNVSIILNSSQTSSRYGYAYRYGYGYGKNNYRDYNYLNGKKEKKNKE